MEKEKDETLYKTRSARACIADGLHCYTGNFRCIFRATWLPLLLFAILSGVAEAFLVTYYPLVVLALLPVFYLIYRFLLRRRLTIPGTVNGSTSAYFHHFGILAVVAFVTFIFCAVVWTLTSVPAVILGIANIQAHIGELYGDPLGMPSNIKWLTIAVFILASFMQAYIYLAFFFPIRYAQGAAVAAENERAQAILKTSKTA
jgi:hypothetical protein